MPGFSQRFLKASFLFSIRSIRRHSASENQSGLFRISLATSSVAFSTTCSSNLIIRSLDDRRFTSSGESSSKKSLIFFWKFESSLFLRMELSIFFDGFGSNNIFFVRAFNDWVGLEIKFN